MKCNMEVIQLKHKAEALLAKMSHLNDEVMRCQRQRQKEIWRLLALITSEVLSYDCCCYTEYTGQHRSSLTVLYYFYYLL